MTRWRSISTAILLALLGATLPAQQRDEMRMTDLLRPAAAEVAAQVAAQTAVLRIDPADAPALLTQVFAEELHKRGLQVRTAPAPEADEVEISVGEMYSSTAPGPNSSYLRNSALVFTAMVRGSESTIRWSREYRLQASDSTEFAPEPSTRDWLRDGGSWIDTVLEPAVVVVAAAIILVLLFTVRGSS